MHNKFILFLLILFYAGLNAQSNSILFEANKPSVGQSLACDGSSEYASVTPSLKLTGQFSANKTTISVDSSFACNQVYGRWTFTINKVNDAGAVNVYFVNDKADATANSGYYFSFGTDEKFYLYSIAAGTATARITSSGTYSLSTNYVIEILRNTNGAFTLTANGASVGSVTNATYTSSNYCFVDVGTGDVVSSLACEYGEGSLDLNSYERILHSDNRGFEATTGFTWSANNVTATVVPTSYTVNAGTGDSNPVDSVQTQDAKYVTVQELAGGLSGADCLNVSFNLTVPTGVKLDTLYFKGFYEGSPTHTVKWQAYNGSTWDFVGDSIVSTTTNTLYKLSGFLPTHNRSGSVTIRVIHHSGIGNLTHYLDIDYVAIKYVNNHSVAISSTDKKSGAYSMAITSTAAGDATTNYVSLASDKRVDVVAGKKYTLELWARGTGALGSELIANTSRNSNFSAGATDWANNGNHSASVVSEELVCVASGASNGSANAITLASSSYISTLTNGVTYKFTFTVRASSGTPTLRVRTPFDWGGANTQDFVLSTSPQTFSITKVRLALENSYFGLLEAGTFILDNISVKPVTLPTFTLALGNQTKSVTGISCVPGTFTKLVWNFQATSNEIGQALKMYVNQEDVVYVDDVSIKQAKDRIINVWFKTSTTGTKKSLVSRYASSTGMHLYVTTGNKLECILSDGTTTKTITGGTTVIDGNWKLATVTVDRIGNMNLYLNGTSDATAIDVTSIGAINTTANLNIGFNSADYFNGNIGESQLAFSDDIAQSNVSAATLLGAYRGGLTTWTNGIPVAWYKWRGVSDGQMLRDYSNSANNLSGSNVTTADQERGAYPSK